MAEFDTILPFLFSVRAVAAKEELNFLTLVRGDCDSIAYVKFVKNLR